MALFRKKSTDEKLLQRIKREKRKSPLLVRLGLAPAVIGGNLITSGLELITGKKYARQTTKDLAKTTTGRILGTATVGVATALGVALAPATAVSGLKGFVKTLIPKTALGKTIGLVSVGALGVSPALRKATYEAPRRILETGEKLGGAIEDLPKEDKEGKGKLGLILAGATALIGGAVIIPKILDKAKDVEIPALPLPLEKPKDLPITSEVPLTPETATITTGKKPYKRRRAKIIPSVRQSVKINIVNRNSSKRYLNQVCYA